MLKRLIYYSPFLWIFIWGCDSNKAIKVVSASMVPQKNTSTILLEDFTFYNSGAVHDGQKGFLQRNSAIRGGDYSSQNAKFSIGLIDYNGDKIFNEPGVDLCFVTTYGNRNIRINNGYGVSVSKVSQDNCLYVDSIKYNISYSDNIGAQIIIEKIEDTTACWGPIHCATRVPNIYLEDYSGKKRKIKELIGERQSCYIYFWVSRPFEDGNNLLRYMNEHLSDKIAIIGMYSKFADVDIQLHQTNFFAMLGNPWPQLICPRDLYMELNQDLSWYKGLIIDKDLNIEKTFVSPSEALEWIEKK